MQHFLKQAAFFLLGSKQSPYQYTHHAVLLLGGFGYLACSIFNYIFQTADTILAIVQLVLFFLVMGIWYLSRWRDQYRSMALAFMFLMVLVALPVNWIYNAGLAGPTYFLNLCTLAYISVAFRDFGLYRTLGLALAVIIPLGMSLIDLYRPELIYAYPSDIARVLDMSFSFAVTAILLVVMMAFYSRRYRLERDKAEHLASQLRLLSEQDPLTGLHNRRAMDQYLEALRSGHTGFSLAILDLDHFKKINDRYGHSYGDEVLCLYAEQLRHLALQCQGLAVRLGGEEFVLVLPMSQDEALSQLEQLKQTLSQVALKHGAVTFSAGLVRYRAGESQDQLLNRADHLLYDAKDAGRNCILPEPAVP